ncbi:glycerol acyltransferase [Porphyromonas macacae]|uniref:Glycerol acyltransferase n=1 Tax=Porphyromonas macacae TaxID=28115 RepID=A0A0A2E5A4_9PORP|nr:1-acyl-sn-glycerol-3-phosphate acyltransferase [Porphyromonas macacae]KGN74036.1 glycerol acyltransferase [Porphyromonas macacae]
MKKSQQIYVSEIIEGSGKGPLPRFVYRLLEKITHQEEINYILRTYGHLKGVEFMGALIGYFNIKANFVFPERLPENGRCIFVCNHPLGSLDGICISYLLGKHYGDIRYVVNGLLYRLKPLRNIFLPVVLSGDEKKRRKAVEILKKAMRSDVPVGVFPAGACSRKINGKIQDLPWRKTFLKQAIQYERDIVPLHFVGFNSPKFYNAELIRRKMGIKNNYISLFLPDQMFRSKEADYKIVVGNPIPWQSIDRNKHLENTARDIRQICYDLQEEYGKLSLP